MIKKIVKWIRQHYLAIVNSIAFYPVIIASCFLVLAVALISFDFSDYGHSFKASINWLSLKDPSTARTIIATVAGGILSLTVFSFSMVMILLNQAAVNMSNRILDTMIGNRFHQFVLGFYIGTIVFAFFLLSTIRDVESGILIPSISIYVLIILTIIDIFLFIYFLHYITQSVKYETIITRISKRTQNSLQRYFRDEDSREYEQEPVRYESAILYAEKTGYYQGFADKALLEFCMEHNYKIAFLHPLSTYYIKGSAIATVWAEQPLSDEHTKHFHNLIDLYERKNSIGINPYLGCKQLTEVAVKALSPGINDPGTAILSINALSSLLAYCLCHTPENTQEDEKGVVRITTAEYNFTDYFTDCMLPIWDYGKNDRMVQQAMLNVLGQITERYPDYAGIEIVQQLLNEVKAIADARKI